MDDDPPDPFSPDAHAALPGDVVTPRTASARRALRDHELVLRAHESGTGEYRKMLVDAEQGMEKLLEMNRALRKELELERRAGGSAGGIGTHSNGTQTAVLAATLEDTRARLRETEVQLDMVTASFEALKRERRCALPAIVGFSGVAENARLVAAAPSIGDDATPFRSFFWFSRTEHLNALAHALASPRRQMLVLRGEERGQGARGRVVTVTLSWWLLVRCRRSGVVRTAAGDADGGNVAASALLQALVARRTRWGQVCVELRVERACALAAPACDDEERLGVTMGEVRYS